MARSLVGRRRHSRAALSIEEQEEFLEHGRFGERKRRFTWKVLAIVVAIVVAAATLHIFQLDESSHGFVIWNENEAYLFVKINRMGYKASFLKVPWILLREVLTVGVEPSEIRGVLVVIRVTSSSVERHVVQMDRSNGGPGSDPERLTPIDGHIYAFCPFQGLCRWAGDHFEPATQEERSNIGPDLGPTSPLDH
jgi:hypothetical protein